VLAWNSTKVPEEFHECPDVYRLSNDSNVWLLAGSFMPSHNARYWVGSMEIVAGERLPTFTPRTSWLWDFGSYYAPRTGAAGDGAGDGRRVLFGWSGWMSNKYNGVGFGGVCDPDYHNIPRDVSLGDDGYMNISPVHELVNLRVPGSRATGSQQLGRGAVVDAVLRCSSAAAGVHTVVGMDVLASTDRTRYFRLLVDLGVRELVANSTRFLPASNQTKPSDAPAGVNRAPLPPTALLFPLELRVVVDGLMVEAFLNNRTALTTMLPAPPGWVLNPSALGVFAVAEPTVGAGDASPACTLETYQLHL
jgi:sucrose-6-phosphate hydrolase SacC (GH32 family)